MSRPIHARIDLAALRHNHAIARRHAGSAKIWSVIKANAYGHGALRVARGLAQAADGFALIELDMAIALRDAGIRQPLLMLEGFYAPEELPVFARLGLVPVVHRLDQAALLAESGLAMPIYLKLNTGMNRLGMNRDEMAAALDLLRGRDITFMTHYSDADEPLGVEHQRHAFADMAADVECATSFGNSATLLRFPHAIGDWVRPGIMLYGASPFPAMQTADAIGLRPVMTLTTELLAVRELRGGDRVGYAGAFVAPRPMRIGIVAGGYGDGYPRHAPTGTPILVEGRRTRTLGRVSMDKICVDLSGIDNARVGSEVILWGDGLGADDVATSAETVSYELFCALAARVPVREVD